MIRLLALDIDGTLLDSDGRVPEANLRAVARAIDAGVIVTLATGRRFDFARPIFEQLPEALTLILSNGAVVKTRQGETLVRHLLPRDVARRVLQHVPHHPGEASVTFDRPGQGQVVFAEIDWEHPRHHRFFATNRPYLSEVNPLEDCLTEDPIQLMFSGGCADMRRVLERLRSPNGNGHGPHAYEATLTEYVHRDFSLVDVTRAGCSKGAALRELAARHGLAAHQVMAIGDNLNDLAMLEFAGRPVLMGNALPELKARGWAITGSNDEAGVAAAIETFVLDGAS